MKLYYKGGWWLVLRWKITPSKALRLPDRVVGLEGLDYREVENQPHRFVLKGITPQSVLNGKKTVGFVQEIYKGDGITMH